MSELQVKTEKPKSPEQVVAETQQRENLAQWETPKLEDVSEQVMAQPYIRFT
jgi:hypothetical protein